MDLTTTILVTGSVIAIIGAILVIRGKPLRAPKKGAETPINLGGDEAGPS